MDGPGDSDLTHSGVPGMKWGVRKISSARAAVKAAPKTRTTTVIGKKTGKPIEVQTSTHLKKNHPVTRAIIKSRAAKKDNALHLTDHELKARVERLNLEKRFKDLTESQKTQGKSATNAVLKQVGTKAVVALLPLVLSAVAARAAGGSNSSKSHFSGR